MKQQAIVLFAVMGVLSMVACKKDNDTPKFSAKGFWTGKVYLYDAALLNRDNGTTRFYIGMTNSDTATALNIVEGVYSAGENIFEAAYPVGNDDTAYLKTDKTLAGLMSGSYRTKNVPGVSFPFEFKKP
ncbi:MAG: hypothetical protein ACTHMV_08475 [Chitinophagaceae bacterium]